MTRTTKTAAAVTAKALLAGLDRLPVAFALFDAGRRLAAWNAPLAALGLFPKSLIRQRTPLAEFQRRDAGLKRQATSPHDINLPDGRLLQATRSRVPPGQLLITYEDVTEARRARSEATEALERQTATADILRVISSSPTDIQPVLRAVAESAARLCDASDVHVRLVEADLMRVVVQVGNIKLPEEANEQRISSKSPPGRAIVERKTIHIHDVAETRVREEYPDAVFLKLKNAFRSLLVVPMVREGAAIGTISVRRAQVQPFSEQQIKLLETFAAQAVIAIENVRLFNETKEALERRTATAEILKVIASSPTDVQPVFEAIVRSALQLIGGNTCSVTRLMGGNLHLAAFTSTDPSTDKEYRALYPQPIEKREVVREAIRTGKPQFVPDVAARMRANPGLGFGKVMQARRVGSLLLAPLVRDGVTIGLIHVARAEAGSFSANQIELIETFADQAVIAIENVRLFNETREALERQTATADILKVISGSPTNLRPVFDAILSNATRLCDAHLGILNLYDGEKFRTGAQCGGNPVFAKWLAEREPFRPAPHSSLARMAAERRPVQVSDITKSQAYLDGAEVSVKMVKVGGARTFLAVPLLKEDTLIGSVGIYRAEVRPFTDRQIALVRTFADQAVIAIENVRLFNETSEALDRQTASAEILKVISGSPTNTQPVFDAIVQSAARLFPPCNASLMMREGELIHLRAVTGPVVTNIEELRKLFPIPFDLDKHRAARAIAERRIIEVLDTEGPETSAKGLEMARTASYRSVTVVPLVREGVGIGAIALTVPQPGFRLTPGQLNLVQTFADQAAIAIENVRLFNETQEALERQTATADVLRVISSSPTNLEPVYRTILESITRLCESQIGALFLYDGEHLTTAATHGTTAEFAAVLERARLQPSRQTSTRLAALERRTVHVADLLSDPEFSPTPRDLYERENVRTVLSVPMLRENTLIGVITTWRRQVRPFGDRQVGLVQTFADQAVIAIENVRLFNETKESLERQTATAEILKVIASSPSDVQPVFDAIARSAYRLIGGFSTAVARVFDDVLHLVAFSSTGESGNEALKHAFPMPVSRSKAARTAAPVCISDTEALPESAAALREVARVRGFRSIVIVPLLREGVATGTISVTRRAPGEFSDHQVDLLKTFADQAVIAIENVRLFNETKEALERQTATSEILASISGSMTDTKPVFDAIVRNLRRLFGTRFAVLQLLRDGIVEMPAVDGEPGFEKLRDLYPRPLDQTTVGGQVMLSKQTLQITPVLGNPATPQATVDFANSFGFNSLIAAPMIREGKVIGAIITAHRDAVAFDEKQLALLRTFADQAVIAIENVRLFNETRESLERQTATAEILKVISSSLTDVQPVFDVIVKSALRLFDGHGVGILLAEGDLIQLGSAGGIIDLEAARKRYPLPLNRDTVSGQAIVDRSFVNIADSQAPEMPEMVRSLGRALDYRAVAAAPMMREGVATGSITLLRKTPGALAEKEVALLKTFADQAVIAIENVRLFNETKEALERQTATAEILKVISGSPTDTQPVFDAIVKSAARLFSRRATLRLVEADGLRRRAVSDLNSARFQGEELIPIDKDSLSGRAVLDRKTMQVVDTRGPDAPPFAKAHAHKWNFRSNAAAPLVRDGKSIGVISVNAPDPGALSDKQMALLATFADQAVIAIENVRLFNETKEALERQTATADVLKAISRSTFDLDPVLQTLVVNATRLCNAARGVMLRGDRDGNYVPVASHGFESDTSMLDYFRAHPQGPGRESMTGRVLQERRTLQIDDVRSDPEYKHVEGADLGEIRTLLGVPMLRDGEPIGVIALSRGPNVQPFSVREIELVTTFADQAVIAIENVRLFNETKESLERQTATAEILKVIASSPSNVQPVLEAIVSSAARLVEPCNATIVMRDGNRLPRLAIAGPRAAGFDLQKLDKEFPLAMDIADSTTALAILEGRTIEIPDTDAEDVADRVRASGRAARMGSFTIVPLLREGSGIGAIVLSTQQRGFKLKEKQLALMKTFADQAVIAIENVRLFNETKEALEQQTATAEILQVISGSPTDTQPVFEAIVQAGLRLFPESTVLMTIPGGAQVRAVAVAHRDPAAAAATWNRFPIALSRDRLHGAAILDGTLIDFPDVEAETEGRFAPGARNFLASGNRAITIAPMMCGDAAIGAISVARVKTGPLGEKQVALLRTFAAQAVIAIENVRVFKELEARTGALSRSVEQLTALGEVGQSISSTLDLDTVLRTIVSRAVQLTGMDGGSIYEYDERTEEFQLRAAENLSDEVVTALRETPARKGEGVIGHAVETGEPTEIAEMLDDSYQSPRRDVLIRAGYRALLVVPLRREDHIIGALAVNRKAPGHFSHEVVGLLKTFATQSALAIQNARLFREIAEKGRQLEEASQHKSQFLASMSHELRTPLNAILGFNEMILGQVYGDVPGDMKEPLEDIQKSGKHLLRLINNVLDLAKIEAGRMELALSDYSVQDTVESVRSTLRPLAAEKGLELLASVPNELPLAYGDGGRISQCLMNLAGNSLKFTRAGKVEISVEAKGELLRYKVADTGIGIPPDKIGSLFTEFKQTDATIASEYGGTGLGLSISRKFVEMHGGRIWVESEPGKGSAFIFEIPLRAKAS